jgi:alpha-L-rhamnosidase
MRRLVCALLLVGFVSGASAAEFKIAKPVWLKGREKERNLNVGFQAVLAVQPGSKVSPGSRPILRVAASTEYRAFLNGRFLGQGPARGPHGFFRVDEWELPPEVAGSGAANCVAIEVAGYNVNSYAWLDQPSFLQAEVVADGKVLASTGDTQARVGGVWVGSVFTAHVLGERVQKVQRYSFQRPFTEVYRLRPGYDGWRVQQQQATDGGEELVVQPVVKLLERGAPYPRFDCRPAVWDVSGGRLEPGQKVEHLWKDRSLTGIGPKLGGYLEADLEVIPSIELQAIATTGLEKVDRPMAADAKLALGESSCHIVDCGTNLTGFIGLNLACAKPTKLYATFDEVLRNGDVDFKRLGCVNAIELQLEPGEYRFESFEPYTLRYLKLMVVEGECSASGLYLRELANPDVNAATFAAADPRLNRLFEAGRETFRQNAVDIFMDCPSRERAGWLCDSFFTSRVAYDLAGNAAVEKNFVENFALPKAFPHLPEGMLPMCYPSDHNDGVFIPNWAMWFVVELDEYLARTGDKQLVEALRPRVLKLFEYFKPFENSDGLLEKLQSWVFVEWSAANNFVQDVNYPSNMLYAGALAAAGRMYDLPQLTVQAEKIRATIRKQAFDGKFFIDNAMRKDGKLEVTKNHTETCQYYAFFFDVATPDADAELWRTLVEQFGPKRKDTKAFPGVPPSNSFIGNMLRMEMLSRYGRSQQILNESIDYLLYMAEGTGTLWENVHPGASCNHGFASHAVHTLYRDILGVRRIDLAGHVVQLRFAQLELPWCEGRLPTPDGFVSVRWWKDGGKLRYRADVPSGYRVELEPVAGVEAVRVP